MTIYFIKKHYSPLFYWQWHIWGQEHYSPNTFAEFLRWKRSFDHMYRFRSRHISRGRVTHICVINLTIIASDNGLSPGRRQVIIWTNERILLIELLGTKFSEILIKVHTFSFKKMHLKMSSAKWRPFCLGLNVLIKCDTSVPIHQVSMDT